MLRAAYPPVRIRGKCGIGPRAALPPVRPALPGAFLAIRRHGSPAGLAHPGPRRIWRAPATEPRGLSFLGERWVQNSTKRAMRAAVLLVAVLALITFPRADAATSATFTGVGTRWAFQAITEWSFAYELIRPQARYLRPGMHRN